MKKIEELEKIEGNGKVILLNTDNGHWARMSKEWYNRSIQTVEEKEKFGQMLEERFGLLGEGVEKSHSIKSIYYSMTGKCNLNCEFCTMNSGPHVSTENDLTLSEIRNNLIPKLQKLNPRKVILTGGEPLVRKDVNEIIQSFSEVFGREKIILQSNGLLLTVEQLRKISGDIGILEISIENIFENPKLQEHMEQFFKCANELGIRLSLSFVVDSKSRKYLYDAIELCHKYEANLTTRIVPLGLDGRIEDYEYIKQIAGLLGIDDKLHCYPKALSSGERQKVSIARALSTKPAVILADEPTGNLDSREAQEVIGLLKMTCREFNQTVVLVTHEKEIADMADQVIFLKDGKIAAMERRQKNYVG